MEKIRKELLAKYLNSQPKSISPDDDDPTATEQPYDCPVCNNVRWLSSGADYGEPGFGDMVACECQEIVWGSAKGRLKRYSQLSDSDFVNFKGNTIPDGHNKLVDPESFRAAFETARQFAENPRGWLVFSGPIGVGKTHLTRAIAHQCIENGIPVKFENCLILVDRLYGYRADNALEKLAQDIRQAAEADILILDDFGSHGWWGNRQLLKIVEYRYKEQLPTVITINRELNVNELDPLFARLNDPDLVVKCNIKRINKTKKFNIGDDKHMLDSHTFDTFKTTYKPRLTTTSKKFIETARRDAYDFARNPDKWLFISGPTYTGKTHLAYAIMGEMLARGYDVIFREVQDMLDELSLLYRRNYDTGYENEFSLSAQQQSDIPSLSFFEALQRFKKAGCLILDKLGSERLTSWSEAILHQIIVYRYDHHLPTVITSLGLIATVKGLQYESTLENIYSPKTEHIGGEREGRPFTSHYLDAILARLYNTERVQSVVIEHIETPRNQRRKIKI